MSAAGTWNLVMQTPIGERKVTLTLQSAGGTLTGKMSAEGNSTTSTRARTPATAPPGRSTSRTPCR